MNEPQLPWQSILQLSVGQTSKAGIKPVNEDAIGIRIPDDELMTTKGAVVVLADGVSAAEKGKEASETCVQNFLSDYYSTPDAWTVVKSAQKVLTALNRWLFSQGQSFVDQQKGYITTFSALVMKSNTAYMFHVGDSRIYRLRDGDLEQLSRDHSMPVSGQQNYLTRAMGLDISVDVDYQKIALEAGDIFLLSTDGVHDFITDKLLKEIVDQHGDDLEAASDALVAKALENGSDDNLSCQLVRVESLPQQQVDEVVSKLTALPFPPFLKAGMTLDGLKVIREIYSSTRSQLYLVENTETGEQCCMKTPSVNFEDDPAYIERFVMESWIGARINNVHVVKIVEPPQRKSCLYYLTEYVNGQTLSQWIKENPKPAVQEVVYLVDQIAKGLRAFHRRETLHQDIKPDNIIIDRNGVAKILDFGSCHVAGVNEVSTPLTRDVALGTACYSAPEHTMMKKASYAADLFSLAVVSFEMFTGQLPFGGKLSDCRKQQDFLNTKYTPSYQLNPLVPVWIDGALKKALRYSPERRHFDVMEFVYELQNPNNKYIEQNFRPLAERDPVLFWKIISGGLLVGQLVCLYFLVK